MRGSGHKKKDASNGVVGGEGGVGASGSGRAPGETRTRRRMLLLIPRFCDASRWKTRLPTRLALELRPLVRRVSANLVAYARTLVLSDARDVSSLDSPLQWRVLFSATLDSDSVHAGGAAASNSSSSAKVAHSDTGIVHGPPPGLTSLAQFLRDLVVELTLAMRNGEQSQDKLSHVDNCTIEELREVSN